MTRRVLIRTLPLHSNYGGILQAYALQHVIRELGFDPVTDTSTPLPWDRRLRSRVWAVRRAIRMALPARMDWTWRAPREVTADQRRFITRRIRIGSFVETAGTRWGSRRLARGFRTVVVGSDQVWRAAYASIPEQFLNLLEDAPAGGPKRISYAASFGLDGIDEYSDDDRRRARELIRRFDAVSVREESGVSICRDAFGVRADRHIDPTMLLTASHYVGLMTGDRIAGTARNGGLLSYRLDANADLVRIEKALADRFGGDVRRLLPAWPPATYAEYESNRVAYDLPSVERWLAAFAHADFVVTDSFHGCVFAILFNRPFVAYANETRGASRFSTLLDVFGLRHHLVAEPGDIDERVFSPDWNAVNRILETERAKAMAFLSASL